MNHIKQAIYYTVGNVTYLFAQWVFTVIVTRVSGFDDAGILTLAISVSGLLNILQTYGIRSYQVSDMTNHFSSRQYILFRYVSVSVGVIICLVFLVFSGYTKKVMAVIFFYTLFRSFDAISDVYFGELQKKGRLDVVALSLLIKSVLMLVLFFLGMRRSLITACFIICILAFFMMFGFDGYMLKKIVVIKCVKLSFVQILQPFKECFPLLLIGLFPGAIISLPRILLEKYYTAEILGYYGNISTPTVLITAVVPSVLGAFLTLYGQLIVEKKYDKLLKNYYVSLFGSLFLGFCFAIGVFFCGNFIMSFIYTDKILPYVRYMYILIAGTVMYAFTMCGNAVLIALRKNRQLLFFSSAALLTCCLVFIPLVKIYSMLGVVIVMIVSNAVQFLLQLFYIKRVLKEMCR